MKFIDHSHRAASIAMIVLGLTYIVLYPRALLNERIGWVWDVPGRNFAMEHMFIAVFVSMGVFLILGARDPMRFLPFIDFVIVSGIAHGTAMGIDAWRIPGEQEHLLLSGDVVGMLWGPALLMICHPRRFYLGGLLTRAP